MMVVIVLMILIQRSIPVLVDGEARSQCWGTGVGGVFYRVSLAFICGDRSLDGVCGRVVDGLSVRG